MRQFNKVIVFAAFLWLPYAACAQQTDRDYIPEIRQPLFEAGKGPIMLVDGGHHNFHTLEDKFAPFGKIAEMNGFRVQNIPGGIDSRQLNDAKILVIANALNEKNVDSWQNPVYPAFTEEEIQQIRNWVWNGGRLFLIADHMPFPAAADGLAQTMGYTLLNGFALRKPKQQYDIFSYAGGTLAHNRITDMHGKIDSIVTFTGHAFKIPDSATSVITLDSSYKVLMPEVAWEFNNKMKIAPAGGLSQLAYSRFGKGKVVMAGEAMMFTAQKAGNFKIGVNAPFAPYNLQLLLNIFEWLNE